MMTFETPAPTEAADIAEIARCLLVVQKRYAEAQQRPLGRGTHTKGICCRGTFEVFDLQRTVTDPALRAKLARGVFARPGSYPATVRFANAASTIYADSKADVRAMSFSIDIPAGVAGPSALRHDYTMNNASIFPIDNAHGFAVLMRVKVEEGGLRQALAFFKLPFRDQLAVLRTGMIGMKQEKQPLRPYQQTRFWSNVPFLHGADQAVKYSAMPVPTNAGHPIGTGEYVLADELRRHLQQDVPASFDFGLQILDADRMQHKGRRYEPSYWVEHASVDWDEREAPFHTVARLTLERNSILPDDQCQAQYIDVTEHCLPESRPIGSINRARWSSESSSRKARMAGAAAGIRS